MGMEGAGDVPTVYADDIYEMQNLGVNFAIIYFAYETNLMGGDPVKVPVLRVVRPKTSMAPGCPLAQQIDALPDMSRKKPVRLHA